jgi:hypothetical protein
LFCGGFQFLTLFLHKRIPRSLALEWKSIIALLNSTLHYNNDSKPNASRTLPLSYEILHGRKREESDEYD